MRWVALAFDGKTDRLVEEIELTGLQTEMVMRIVGARNEDDVIGVSIDFGQATRQPDLRHDLPPAAPRWRQGTVDDPVA